MPTLYRKYRPQSFAEITGQAVAVTTLTNAIILGRVAHAYLFSGPRGVGKTTLARLLAKAVNCERRKESEAEPCNQCGSCLAIAAGRSLDVLEIDAASHTGVDNVRENIVENARFQPTQAPFKIFIIDEVHMLSGSAFNALLKTLEEPPAHVIFILATTELHKLPATVVSRCQRFQFKKIPFAEMLARLVALCKNEGVKVDKAVLERVVRKSDGCLRDAESLLGQILSLNLKTIVLADAELMLPPSAERAVLNFLQAILGGDAPGALFVLRSASAAGENFDQFGLDLIFALRALLSLSVGAKIPDDTTAEFSPTALTDLAKLAKETTPAAIHHLTDAALKRRAQIKTAPLPELPLELLVVECCHPAPGAKDNGEAAPALVENTTKIASAKEAKKMAAPYHKEPSDQAPGAPAKSHSLKQSLKSALSTITGSHPPPTATLEQIKNEWPNLITAITSKNHSLTFILSMCTLEAVDAAGLHLVFPYSLHKEKIEEHKNQIIIEECLAQVFHERIPVVCAVKGAEAPAAKDTELVSLALEFGGEIVA